MVNLPFGTRSSGGLARCRSHELCSAPRRAWASPSLFLVKINHSVLSTWSVLEPRPSGNRPIVAFLSPYISYQKHKRCVKPEIQTLINRWEPPRRFLRPSCKGGLADRGRYRVTDILYVLYRIIRLFGVLFQWATRGKSCDMEL